MGGGGSKPASSPGPSFEDLQREKDARNEEKLAREKLQKQLADMKEKNDKVIEDSKQKTNELLEMLQRLQQQMQQEQADKTKVESESKLIEARLERERLEAETVAKARQEEIARQDARLQELQQKTLEAQKTISEKENDLRCYPIPVYMLKYKSLLNIAVTGASGVGKSSLLNALRRIKSTDPEFARVGDTETTMEPAPYKFPVHTDIVSQFSARLRSALRMGSGAEDIPFDVGDKVILQNIQNPSGLNGEEVEIVEVNSTGTKLVVKCDDGSTISIKPENVTGKLQNCILWDLPGAGTPQFPQKTYIQLMGIRHFDLVALLTAERFTEAEAALMKELKYWNVPFVAVRTKIDQAIDAAIALKEEVLEDDLPEDSKAEISVSVVGEVKSALKEKYDLGSAYTISTLPKLRKHFDFLELEKDMRTAVKHQRGVSLERECPVCFDDYSDYGGSAGQRLAARPCGHTLCADCWQCVASICPICRVPVTVPQSATSSASASSGESSQVQSGSS